MSEPEPEVVEALVRLGFSLNASRAYHALLLGSPATGYEVSIRARIPRSAVYRVLRQLVAEGAARSIAGKPERFAPTPPEDVLVRLRQRFEVSAGALEDAIGKLDASPVAPDAFSVRGHARVMEEAERLIRGARARLVISGWPRELALLVPALRRAARRKVLVVIFSHATLPAMPGEVFSYGLDEAELERFWKHRLVIVADDLRTLIASAEDEDEDEDDRDLGVVSEVAPTAEVATSQIALDITLLSQRTGRDVQAVMARMLGDRVGRLDSLLGRGG